MKKRLFIAIDLPKDIKEYIKVLEKEIDKKVGQKLLWINEESLHLTLLFLGYIDENKVESVISSLGNIPKQKSFSVKINEINYGPDEKIKRMVWLKFKASTELVGLQKTIVDALEKNGIEFKKEDRPFLSHINLIRFKESIHKPAIKQELNLEFIVDSFSLKESVLKRTGAEYSNVAVFKLA